MVNITMNDKSELTISTTSGSFEILMGGNTDLYLRPVVSGNLLEAPNEIEIEVDDSNSFVYGFIEQLYNSIMYCNPHNKDKVSDSEKEKEYEIDRLREYPLREGKEIFWRSNESLLDTASILRISKDGKIFKFKFIKGLVGGFMYTYAINICNSGSIYYPYNIPFYDMYINMCENLKNKVKIKE